jgi:hypothetical protein
MSNDALLKSEGLRALSERLGPVGMERFIVLMSREFYDYTQWHEGQPDSLPAKEISRRAAAFSAALPPPARAAEVLYAGVPWETEWARPPPASAAASSNTRTLAVWANAGSWIPGALSSALPRRRLCYAARRIARPRCDVQRGIGAEPSRHRLAGFQSSVLPCRKGEWSGRPDKCRTPTVTSPADGVGADRRIDRVLR